MTAPMAMALPSKGRLKEQVEAWLADCGLSLKSTGGERGYRATLSGIDTIDARLASASDIAAALANGEVHLGVTGEDLLGEAAEGAACDVMVLAKLGFGRADLVVAAPRSWVDVETMADVGDVARLYLARTGRRMRVATKYHVQTRAFFARHGIVEYRIAESGGATEGAPAAGAAELIVDITTTGATLAANGLKVVSDGLILRSEAQLVASLGAEWSEDHLRLCRRLLGVIEARSRAKTLSGLTWPAAQDQQARSALERFVLSGGLSPRPHGLLLNRNDLFEAMSALTLAGIGPVIVDQPLYVFEPHCAVADQLELAAGRVC